jgi:UDP-3-O-[3-hydroxymyristoyl] glucosamine N-acyltransferase
VSSPKSFKLSQLATLLGAELEGDPDKEVIGINSLAEASDSEVSFLAREAYIPQLASSKAGAVICDSETSKLFNGNKIICSNPYLIYANCTKLFKENPTTQEGISKLASIDSSSSVSDSAAISSFVSISADAVIEDDVILMPGVFVGKGCRVGKGSIIHANVSLYDSVELGKDCIIHSGAVIGSDGLGFAKENNEWVKIEHLGRVLIGNNVEIGSNSTVDRGSIGDTVIGENVKIDNQVHIAHNVAIGSGTAIAGNSAIAGSTKIGKNCTLAGCSAVVDNIEITDEVHITAMTLITKSIKESGFYSSGTPFMKNSDWKKNAVAFKKLREITKK